MSIISGQPREYFPVDLGYDFDLPRDDRPISNEDKDTVMNLNLPPNYEEKQGSQVHTIKGRPKNDDCQSSSDTLPSYCSRRRESAPLELHRNSLLSNMFGFHVVNIYKFLLFISIVATCCVLIAYAVLKYTPVLGIADSSESTFREGVLTSEQELRRIFGSNQEKATLSGGAGPQNVTSSYSDECVQFVSRSELCDCWKLNVTHISASIVISKIKLWLQTCLFQQDFRRLFIYTGTKHELYEKDLHPCVNNWLSQKDIAFDNFHDHFVVYEPIPL